jgi:hypothetical protein
MGKCGQFFNVVKVVNGVDVNEMFRKAAPLNSARMVGASAVSVGD